MFTRIDHVEVIPTDFQRTLDFYTDILGFRLKERFAMDAGPLQEIAYLTLGDTMIELIHVAAPAPASSAEWSGGYRGVALEVPDMDAAVAYLQGKGIPITWGSMHLGSSIRAEIADPDGLAIELRQWLVE